MALPPDFVAELRKRFSGDIRLDLGSRIVYSTDASIYQMEPTGVVLPRTQEDLHAVVELAARYALPILPRGAGTSLAGQAIGHALIIDCSRWLDNILEINPEERHAIAEPGVILSALNRAAAPHGLMFGPDPASVERATIGGVVGNNATGAHSNLYGMTADHLLSADVILADGSVGTLGEIDPNRPELVEGDTAMAVLLRTSLQIREQYAAAIYRSYPKTWRNSAGYRLNYLLPWSASEPPEWRFAENRVLPAGDVPAPAPYPPSVPGKLNLAPLLAGSEGTLAVIRRVKLNLVPRPEHTALAVLAYDSLPDACDDVPRLLAHNPSAVELIPRMLIRLARGVAGYAELLDWVPGDPEALLVVEFSGPHEAALVEKVRSCGRVLRVATNTKDKDNIWNIRKSGLGILDNAQTAARPVAFIEDCAIPVDRLGEFVREVEKTLAEYHAQAAFYAHASAGCLHVRPMLDLRTGEGVHSLRGIAERVVSLTLGLGGVMSSEHGDGVARSEWLEQEYGSELIEAMARLKRAADPRSILNPGKIIGSPRMDSNLRFGADYRSHPWSPTLDFSLAGGLGMAIEQCNGQGVCRKDTGVMCPSYQATRDEMHSTRGRANLLRAMIAGPAVPEAYQAAADQNGSTRQDVVESAAAALDLCLACKGCKAECPTGVDMAKIKTEFYAEYYRTRRRPLSDYLFGYFHLVAALLAQIAPIANLPLQSTHARRMIARAIRVTAQRPFPRFSRERATPAISADRTRPSVLFLPDVFTHFIDTRVERAAFDVLNAAGYAVHVLPVVGGGASLLTKGFLSSARRHALRLLDQIHQLDPESRLPVVGVEPPEIYCVKNDYFDLLPGHRDEISSLSANVWLLDEFLIRSPQAKALLKASAHSSASGRIKFQPHCHQRAEAPAADGRPGGAHATLALLELCGYTVELIDAGCCGMAGTFGYEADHYELSQQIGELQIFPQVRGRGDALIAATGAACRLQIEQGTGVEAFHPLGLTAARLGIIRPEI